MLKVNFFHLCEKVVVEQGTGNLSMISIFENINVVKFPAVHPIINVVVGFENKNPGIYDIELEIMDEKGTISKFPIKVNIGSNGKGNLVYKILGYQIPRELTQKLKLTQEGEIVYEGYLTINHK